jgi:hypothetical protein
MLMPHLSGIDPQQARVVHLAATAASDPTSATGGATGTVPVVQRQCAEAGAWEPR